MLLGFNYSGQLNKLSLAAGRIKKTKQHVALSHFPLFCASSAALLSERRIVSNPQTYAERRRTERHTDTSCGAAEGQNVAARGAFEIHMARIHSPGRGSAWKSLQVSVKGAFRFFFSSSSSEPPLQDTNT